MRSLVLVEVDESRGRAYAAQRGLHHLRVRAHERDHAAVVRGVALAVEHFHQIHAVDGGHYLIHHRRSPAFREIGHALDQRHAGPPLSSLGAPSPPAWRGCSKDWTRRLRRSPDSTSSPAASAAKPGSSSVPAADPSAPAGKTQPTPRCLCGTLAGSEHHHRTSTRRRTWNSHTVQEVTWSSCPTTNSPAISGSCRSTPT